MKHLILTMAALLTGSAIHAQEDAGSLDVKAFRQAMKDKHALVIDVRTASEFREGHIEGAANIDWEAGTLAQDLSGIDKEGPVLLYCGSGKRSGQAKEVLIEAGFKQVHDLAGGLEAWEQDQQPVIRQ